MSHSNQIRSFELTNDGIKIGEMDLSGRRIEFSTT
jgi:hypothetical protein